MDDVNRPFPLVLCLIFAAAVLSGHWASGSETPGNRGDEQVVQEVTRLLAEVDSDRYDVRQRAIRRLEGMVAEPGMAIHLSRQMQRVLVSPGTSLELRKHLERLQQRLPPAEPPALERVSDEEMDRLVRQLEDDSYGARLAAARRLEWLLRNPRLTHPILLRLKGRLGTEGLSPDARLALEPIYQRARGAWLTGDSVAASTPGASDAQISRWLDELAREVSPATPQSIRGQKLARTELQDLLAQDAEVSRVRRALERRLEDRQLSPAGGGRLRELLDLARPAMVAEYWEGRRHLGTQHLIVGQPSLSANQERASHFDRIDDQTAHCVSGQNLSPGDYPVGVAVPHPKNQGAFFHLVNLNTPRRRLGYTYRAEKSQTNRLQEISVRTLQRLLARKTALDERELALLEQLEPHEVSRFAGAVFQAVADRPPPAAEATVSGMPLSHHAAICLLLARDGTREAIPGLLKAIGDRRFLPPTPSTPYAMPYLAALSIAGRDPWPEVDLWLAGLISRTDALVHGSSHSPELGATAAGVLLWRHRQDSSQFGLEYVADETFQELGLSGYRFAGAEGRARVNQWWQDRKKTQCCSALVPPDPSRLLR